MRAMKPFGMLTEFDESEPDSDVTSPTLMVVGEIPGALAVLLLGAVLDDDPLVVFEVDFFDELPHPVATSVTATAATMNVRRRTLRGTRLPPVRPHTRPGSRRRTVQRRVPAGQA
jgi:hypothetical protein